VLERIRQFFIPVISQGHVTQLQKYFLFTAEQNVGIYYKIHFVVVIDLKRITRCKLALIFTSADHRKFLGLFGSEAARL